MNKHISILLGLTILLCSMLACMTTVEPFATYPAETPTAGAPPKTAMPDPEEPESGAVFEITITARCAIVTAAEALHLRSGPSERTEVIEYLQHGEIVTLIDSRGPWWKIATPTAEGWSKADYLAESECG